MSNTNLVLLENKIKIQKPSPIDMMQSSNLMKSLDVEEEVSEDKLSDLEVINLTEWLIFKIKIIYSRATFEGDNPTEASAIRQEWQDLVCKIGKQGVLGTIDYLLSGELVST